MPATTPPVHTPAAPGDDARSWFDAVLRDTATGALTTVPGFDSADQADAFADRLARFDRASRLEYVGAAHRLPKAQALARFGAPADDVDAPSGAHVGRVTRWNRGETFGFVSADPDAAGAASWFVSQDDLVDQDPPLPLGVTVSFTGRPKPHPGKSHPRAYSVRVLDAPE
ncbi:hypothetical protein [Saccharothrix sp. HUAS TT1]|uniref:hypothetical protein n=1 Tax=unclassified Saccharothrix TaxID=2593673 RepID=UPI00345B9E49